MVLGLFLLVWRRLGKKFEITPFPLCGTEFFGRPVSFQEERAVSVSASLKTRSLFFFAACILYKQKRRAFYYPRKRIGESPAILPSFRFEAAWDSPSHVQFHGCFVSGILVGCTGSQQNEV